MLQRFQEWLTRARGSGPYLLAIVVVAQFLDQALSTVLVPIAPSISAEFGLSAILTGLLFSAKPLGNILIQPFVGPLCDHFGRNLPMIVGALLLVSSSLMFGLSKTLPFYFVARVLQGFGTALSATAGMSLLADCYLDDKRRGEVISLAMAGGGIGLLFGPTFGGVFFQYGGLILPYAIIAGLCLFDFLLMALFLGTGELRRQKATAALDKAEETLRLQSNRSSDSIETRSVITLDFATMDPLVPTAAEDDVFPPLAPKPTSILKLLTDGRVIICVMVVGTANAMASVLEPLLPSWLTLQFHTSALATGLIFSAATLGYALSNPVVGYLGTRIGRWRCSAVGCVLLAASMALMPVPGNQYAVIPILFLFGIGMAMVDSSIFPILGVLVDRNFHAAYGSVYALGNLGMAAGFALGPILSTVLQTEVGYDWAMRISGLVTFCVAPLMIFVRKHSEMLDDSPVDQSSYSLSVSLLAGDY